MPASRSKRGAAPACGFERHTRSIREVLSSPVPVIRAACACAPPLRCEAPNTVTLHKPMTRLYRNAPALRVRLLHDAAPRSVTRQGCRAYLGTIGAFMFRILLAALFSMVAASASAAVSDQAARACGITEQTIAASRAATSILATFERDAAFADRGGGPIRIIEFADYSCPACRALHPRWMTFARDNPDVRISVVEYPIYGRTLVSRATGNRTLNASRIAIAAGAQGKQLAFHDALMQISGRVDDGSIRLAAQRAGLDLPAAQRRAESTAVTTRADGNLRLAQRLGFLGTPHVVVDGVLLSLQRGWTFQQVQCLVGAARRQRQ
jgi:protein-disulfide isomerase